MRRTDDHTSGEAMRGLLDGSLPAADRRRIVRHLLSGCEPCVGVALGVIYPECPDYEGIARRLELAMVLAENEVAVERRHGLEGWGSLKPLPSEERLFLVKNQPELRTWGLYEKIIEEA